MNQDKWEAAGLTACGSAQEFAIRSSVTGVKPKTGDDLVELARHAAVNPDLCRVLADLAQNTDVLDGAIGCVEYYVDYYVAYASGANPDPGEYGHIPLLDLYKFGSLTRIAKGHGDPGSSDSRLFELRRFVEACSEKADALFEGRMKSVTSFSEWIKSH